PVSLSRRPRREGRLRVAHDARQPPRRPAGIEVHLEDHRARARRRPRLVHRRDRRVRERGRRGVRREAVPLRHPQGARARPRADARGRRRRLAPVLRRPSQERRHHDGVCTDLRMNRLAFVFLLVVLVLGSRASAQDAATMQLLQEADRAYDTGDYERAASNFDRAIRSQPKDVPAAAYAKRASLFLFAKKYDEGLRFIEDVAEKTWPEDDTILEQKAVMLSRQGAHKKEAVALAERVVERRPSAYTLQSLLGDYNYQLGAPAADKTVARYEAYLK